MDRMELGNLIRPSDLYEETNLSVFFALITFPVNSGSRVNVALENMVYSGVDQRSDRNLHKI